MSKLCVGFGPYEGKCENEAGTPWTPYWCPRCDKLRKEHISEQLEGILNGFAKPPKAIKAGGDDV